MSDAHRLVAGARRLAVLLTKGHCPFSHVAV